MNSGILDGLGCVMGLMHTETNDELGKSPYLVIKSHSDYEWNMHASCLQCIKARIVRSDVKDPQWSSHDHCV